MSSGIDISGIADRLVATSEAGDVAEMTRLFAVDAMVWRSDLGSMDPVQLGEVVGRLRSQRGNWSYRERRIHIASHAFVEQHLVDFERAELPAMVACVVAEVTGGLITRMDEYISVAGGQP